MRLMKALGTRHWDKALIASVSTALFIGMAVSLILQRTAGVGDLIVFLGAPIGALAGYFVMIATAEHLERESLALGARAAVTDRLIAITVQLDALHAQLSGALRDLDSLDRARGHDPTQPCRQLTRLLLAHRGRHQMRRRQIERDQPECIGAFDLLLSHEQQAEPIMRAAEQALLGGALTPAAKWTIVDTVRPVIERLIPIAKAAHATFVARLAIERGEISPT